MLPPFETVVAEHGARVLRVCRAVVGPDDAEDAWSDTFLAAMSAYAALPADANVEAWLVTIAHRKAIDHYRARSRRAVPVAELPDPGRQTAAISGRDVVGDRAEALDAWAALASLPDKQRHVLAYRHLGGLTYQQIADLLGGTAAAARRAASDGLTSLRRRLGDEGES